MHALCLSLSLFFLLLRCLCLFFYFFYLFLLHHPFKSLLAEDASQQQLSRSDPSLASSVAKSVWCLKRFQQCRMAEVTLKGKSVICLGSDRPSEARPGHPTRFPPIGCSRCWREDFPFHSPLPACLASS